MSRKPLLVLLAVALTLCLCACAIRTPAPTSSAAPASAPISTLAPAAPAPSGTQEVQIENKVELSLDAAQYERDAHIAVTLDFGKLNQKTAIIAVVRSELPHNEAIPYDDDTTWLEYRWLADFSEIPFYLYPTEMADGSYDVRVYADGESGEELACVSFTVGKAGK